MIRTDTGGSLARLVAVFATLAAPQAWATCDALFSGDF